MKFYFHIVSPNLNNKFHPIYQYDYIPLAQGLKILGHEIYSNLNYWKGLEKDFLFKQNDSVLPKDCDVNVFSGLCEYHHYNFPKDLFTTSNTIKVLIDQNDGFFTPLFSDFSKKFDLILHKKNKTRTYPSNCKSSWAFGISNEIIEICNLYTNPFQKRKDSILINFRYGHPVRNYGLDFIKKLKLNYELDNKVDSFNFDDYKNSKYYEMLKFNGGRHRPEYLKRLCESKMSVSFGGFFYLKNILDKNKLTYRLGNYLLADRAGGKMVELIRKSHLYLKKTKHIYQWDSWRVWETFVSGAVNINFDLEYYDVELPAMPINGKHYIGLNFQKSKKYNQELINKSEKDLEIIATNGTKWAIDNYGPEGIAKRFLSILNK